MTDTLEPISPTRAVEMYLRDREKELAHASLQTHEYRLNHFIRWCDEHDLDNLNELTGRLLHEYKLWRRDDGDLNSVTVKTQMDTLRAFIRFCERIDAVHAELQDKVQSPSLTEGENQRDVLIDGDTAETILNYLDSFHYASRKHVVLLLLWRTGMRMGGLRSLDLTDYHPKKARVELRHQPKTDTPLKNGIGGERLVALALETCEVVDDWIEHQRPHVADEYGREPLIATTQGRASRTTIREIVYRSTRPCEYGDCPHGRDPDTCEATNDHRKQASKCPSSVSPHAIRRGSITHHLTNDIPERVISDRVNVSPDVIDDHYDERTEEVKVEQRRGYLNNL